MTIHQDQNIIKPEHIKLALAQRGIEHKFDSTSEQSNPVLAKGNLSFDMFPSGINIHCCDLIEQKNARSTAIVSPCISLNFLLAGKVNFKLADKHYTFTSQKNQPCFFINVIGKKEIFTRYLSHQQAVKKVNITLEKKWLLTRCQSLKEQDEVSAIFQATTQVLSLATTPLLISLVDNLMEQKSLANIQNQLQAEHLTLQIIALCLPQLIKHTALSPINNNIKKVALKNSFAESKDDQLEQVLDQSINKPNSLKNVAQRLGMSISTLQRQVKAKHQVTVNEYLRNKRLEYAQQQLILEGMSIGEVAFSAGYQHVANFVTAFKKRYNITPAQLRKQHLLPLNKS